MQSKISQWDFTRKNIQLYGIFTIEQQNVDLKIVSGCIPLHFIPIIKVIEEF